ncbi:hypothetical protein VPH35_028492 [Triticum aestivum]
MDNLPLTTMAGAAASSLEGGGRVVDTYKKALTTAASVAAYAMLVRSMARELLPEELRAAVRWGAAFVRARLGAGDKERHTIVIRRHLDAGYNENHLFEAARAYLATKIDPNAMRRLCLARTRYKEPDGSSSWSTLLCMDDGGSTTDTFDGVEFKWTSIETGGDEGKKGKGHRAPPRETLELSFDAEHTEAALERYVPFIMSTAEQLQRRDRALKIFMNEGRSWHGINHHHPATFDTLAMDPALKQAVTDDLDRFLKRKEYYRRIGKAWKRGYLLFGPQVQPGRCHGQLPPVQPLRPRSLRGAPQLGASEAAYRHAQQIHPRHRGHRLLLRRQVEGGPHDAGAGRRRQFIRRRRPGGQSPPPGTAPTADHNAVRAAQLHRRAVVDERRGAHHHLHHQLQGPPRPGAAAAGAHGHAHLHGPLLLGGVQDVGQELSPRGRPCSVPTDTGTACGGGGDAGRGV